jgi:hypothetical protein
VRRADRPRQRRRARDRRSRIARPTLRPGSVWPRSLLHRRYGKERITNRIQHRVLEYDCHPAETKDELSGPGYR